MLLSNELLLIKNTKQVPRKQPAVNKKETSCGFKSAQPPAQQHYGGLLSSSLLLEQLLVLAYQKQSNLFPSQLSCYSALAHGHLGRVAVNLLTWKENTRRLPFVSICDPGARLGVYLASGPPVTLRHLLRYPDLEQSQGASAHS